MSEIGKPRRLLDGKEKVLGLARFGTDQHRPRTLHARLVQSPFPHASVGAIETAAALELPGVVAVLTADDLPELEPTSRGRLLLARDRVLFAGHPVALVLGETEAAAQDGSDAVEVDFSPLEAATDMDAALAPNAPAVWPGGLPGSSEEAGAHGATQGDGEDDSSAKPANLAGETVFENGDVDEALARSAAVSDLTFSTAGVHQGYLEPHAVLVEPDPISGGATVYTSTQASFMVRQEVARILSVPESDVNVKPTVVGGGFGARPGEAAVSASGAAPLSGAI